MDSIISKLPELYVYLAFGIGCIYIIKVSIDIIVAIVNKLRRKVRSNPWERLCKAQVRSANYRKKMLEAIKRNNNLGSHITINCPHCDSDLVKEIEDDDDDWGTKGI